MKKRNAEHKKSNAFPCILNNQSFPFVETYNSLRTNIRFASVDKKYRKILVTSSISGEGKSTVAINLAIALAFSGNRVLLIDCDLRKPSLQKYLQIGSNIPGLTSALTGVSHIRECIFHLVEMNIDIVTAGAIPPNPAELLGSNKMSEILDAITPYYDYILFDTPPVSVVTDAAVLANLADGYVLVIKHHFTKIEQVQLAKKNLDHVNACPIGAVLNMFSTKNSNRRYASFQDTHYKNGYQ